MLAYKPKHAPALGNLTGYGTALGVIRALHEQVRHPALVECVGAFERRAQLRTSMCACA
jgi:methylthioribose-1-phosphate isomerase